MMRTQTSKILALLVAVCLIVGMLPGMSLTALAATGSIYMGGDEEVADISQNGSDTGWTWDAASATLTLQSGYNSGNIFFGTTDPVKLVLAGSVTIDAQTNVAISSDGPLTIDVGAHTLTATTSTSAMSWAISGNSDLTISGSGAVIASGHTGIFSGGGLTINGSVDVTATSTGDGNCISANGGININTTGIVIATGDGSNTLNALWSYSGSINIYSGTVNATGALGAIKAERGSISISGGIVTAAAKGTSYALSANSGNGTINISGGTVTATNASGYVFNGTLNHTGGTLNGAGSVCQIGSTNYTTLTAALTAVGNNQTVTIKLLDNITHTGNVVIGGGKQITFDLNGKTLDITVVGGYALEVKEAATVDIAGAGELNVTSQAGDGLVVHDVGSKATVTSATGNGTMSFGVDAYEGGIIIVNGNATATGESSFGASAWLGGTTTILGNVTASGTYSVGAYAQTGTVTVKGNVTATGTGCAGAIAQNSGKITIDGAVSGEEYLAFVDWGLSGTLIYKTQTQYEPTTTKAGYRTYTHTDSDAATYGTSTVWVKIPGGGSTPPSGGEPGGGGGTTTTPSTPPTVTGETVTPKTTTNEETGVTSAIITQSEVTAALANAKKEATAEGTTPTVVIDVPTPAGSTAVEANIPAAAFSAIRGSDNTDLTVKAGDVALTFSDAALSGISGTGDVKISAGLADSAKLSDEQKELVGDRPVFDFSVTVGGKAVTDFGGDVAVSVPYTPAVGENPNAIVVYYIDAHGNIQTIENGVYDPATGKVSFTTTHFSLYMIGYNLVSFTDVPSEYWGRNYIEKAAARGLVSGVGNELYQPDRSVTRAEFAQMIANVLKLSAAKAGTEEYSDVKPGAWYYDAVMNAKSAGLLDKFTGEFRPNQPITREEMAAVLAVVLKQKGVVTGAYAINLGDTYTDFDKMNEKYLDDIMVVTVSKLMQGVGGNKFDPQGLTTRAQAATVQIRLLELLSK